MADTNPDVRPWRLKLPVPPCPCGSIYVARWLAADGSGDEAITYHGCGAVLASTRPLEPKERPGRVTPEMN
jgi:hypothetical protein